MSPVAQQVVALYRAYRTALAVLEALGERLRNAPPAQRPCLEIAIVQARHVLDVESLAFIDATCALDAESRAEVRQALRRAEVR